jgi:DNA-binding CsgD family transcriptional regulator
LKTPDFACAKRTQNQGFSKNCPEYCPREAQIANLGARGLTNAEIGAQLWITQNSVKQALKRMFRKLEVASRTEMISKLHHTIQP